MYPGVCMIQHRGSCFETEQRDVVTVVEDEVEVTRQVLMRYYNFAQMVMMCSDVAITHCVSYTDITYLS